VLINTQRLFSATLAIKLTIILIVEQFIDIAITQLNLGAGSYEGNPILAAQFNQTHSVIQFSLIGKFILPLLLFPAIYFILINKDSRPKFDKFVHKFLIASIFAIVIFYIVIISWNVLCIKFLSQPTTDIHLKMTHEKTPQSVCTIQTILYMNIEMSYSVLPC
jgi:hypothetical protein